jgi:hypothetical protein
MARMAHLTHRPVVTPNRLFGAADELLSAIESPGGFASEVSVYVGPMRIGGSLPPRVFTSDELREAMAMLVRMGFVPFDRVSSRA